MIKRFNPADIEPRWQKLWAEQQLYAAKDFDESRRKYVMLTEFPYPSGDGLHLGHVREYTLGDIMARHKRMLGYNVLYPMGYDAFGLPTENYAIKNKIAPQTATDRNVANFQEQFERLGYSFDWNRSFRTSDPEYYKWTQWLFLQLFKAGLAYQAEISINWCPKCKTGLANEEVVNGKHERCDTPVEKKLLKQWLLKITEYADRLIEGLQHVDYPSRIADQQVNWIGRSKGAEIDFLVDNSNEKVTIFTTRPDTLFGATFMVLAPEHPLVRKIMTTKYQAAVEAYVAEAGRKADIERMDESREKTGVFTGAHAVNPVNGEIIPIWIADYVLASYGTGAIMAVPAHDERDYVFAKKFDLPSKQVIAPETGRKREDETFAEGGCAVVFDPQSQKYAFAKLENGWKCFFAGGVNPDENLDRGILREVEEESGLYDIQHYEEIATAYGHYRNVLKQTNRMAKATCLLVILSSIDAKQTKLEDHEKFSTVWLSAEEVLEEWEAHTEGDYDHYAYFLKQAVARAIELEVDCVSDPNIFRAEVFSGEGVMVYSGKSDGMSSSEAREKIVDDLAKQGMAREKTTYRLRDWIFSRQHYWGEPIPIVHCEKDGAVPVPDDQLPVELPAVEHYEPTDTGESPLAAVTSWVNVTCPICGGSAKRETDTMPNWAGSSWYYLRYFDAHNDKAFADRKKLDYWGEVDLYLGGMEHTTLHLLYSRFWHQFFYDQGLVPTAEPYKARRGQGIILAPDGTKMSKSKGNVINPNEVIDAGYGADALRVAIAFIAPYDQTTPWNPEGVAGTYRFLNRAWVLTQEFLEAGGKEHTREQKDLERLAHGITKKVSEDIHNMSFNTAVAALMEYLNSLYKVKASQGFVDNAKWQDAIERLLKLTAPFAPHVTDELWQQLGHQDSIHIADWPSWDETLLVQDTVTIAVQVNGRVRAELRVAADASEETVKVAAFADNNVKTFVGKVVPKRIVYVPGRILNIVI